MATASTKIAPKNVYQKLIEAREAFLNSYIKQSGKNMKLEFMYFELKDIVPTVTKIFAQMGLIAVDNFISDTATLSIINTDNPEEQIPFSAPFNQIEPIISNAGKQVTNTMQALGSSITYMRRYLYLIAMDICVNDEIEPNITEETNLPVPVEVKPAAPATPVQREEIKQELTAPAENATELQIKGLKKVLKQYREKFPDKEQEISQIAVQTKGFTAISKEDCEKLINSISDRLKEA